jgi:hypothetical protein
MVEKIQIKRTPTPNNPPASLAPGELSVEMSNPTRLWVGVPTTVDPAGKKLLIDVDFINAAKAAVAEEPPPDPVQGQFWYEQDTGILWIFYDDGNTQQWVQVNGISTTGSGIPIGDVSGPIASVHGNVAVFNGTTGKIIMDGGLAGTGDVKGPASAAIGNIAVFDSATGKMIRDGGPLPAGNVSGPASAIADHVAVFDGTTGKLLKDGGPAPGSFPTGTKMLFKQTAAPTGWTKDTTVNDAALRVVSGTAGGGGFVGFSSLFGRTQTDNATLNSAMIPTTWTTVLGAYRNGTPTDCNVSSGFWNYGPDYAGNTYPVFANVAGGGAHGHTIDMRVVYADVIIATKD